MAYRSDEIPLDIGFSLTGLLPMQGLYSNFDTVKISFLKPNCRFSTTMHIFYVKPHGLNDVSIGGSNVIKPPHEKSILVKS